MHFIFLFKTYIYNRNGQEPDSCKPSLSQAQLICTTEPLEEENESWDSMHTYVHIDIYTNTYMHTYVYTHIPQSFWVKQRRQVAYLIGLFLSALDLVQATFEALQDKKS